MKFWSWPNVHPTNEAQIEPQETPKPTPAGRVKIRDKATLRGYRIIPASGLKPSDIVIERYPE